MTAAPNFAASDRVAVFLDFDGTLVPIADRPDLAQAPASLQATLRDAHAALNGALALITGRSIASLDALLRPLRLPAAGVHGMEFRDAAGTVRSVAASEVPEWTRARLRQLCDTQPGLLLEDKVYGLALHFRQAPDLEQRVRTEMADIAARLGADFVTQNGKMVVELRPSCATKGTAVTWFMSQPPFTGRRPIFIGDDITDEDAFRTVNEMGGYSIKVGERDPGSAAGHNLRDVTAVREWLIPLTRQSRVGSPHHQQRSS